MTKVSGLNGTKYYLNSMSTYFPLESNFYLLLSLKIIGTVPHFQEVSWLFKDFFLYFGDETATYAYFSLGLLVDQPT
jgi:hypothetical protein